MRPFGSVTPAGRCPAPRQRTVVLWKPDWVSVFSGYRARGVSLHWQHAARRLRPPPSPFRLFAERRRHQGRQDRQAGTRGGDASGGDHRLRQPVRRAGVQPGLHGERRAADRRLPGRPCPHRPARHATRPGRAAGAGRGGAGQPAAPVIARLRHLRPGRAGVAAAHRARPRGRAVPAHRRDARAARPAAGGGAAGRGGGLAAGLCRGVRRPHGDRAAPPRPGDRAGNRARPGGARRCRRATAGGDQRVLLRGTRDARGARRPAVHRRRPHHGRSGAPPGDGGALVQAGGRHAHAVRRPAGSLRQHARHRPTLRRDGRDAQAVAAGLLEGAARHHRGRDAARHGPRGAGPAARPGPARLRRAAGIRAGRDRRHGLSPATS